MGEPVTKEDLTGFTTAFTAALKDLTDNMDVLNKSMD